VGGKDFIEKLIASEPYKGVKATPTQPGGLLVPEGSRGCKEGEGTNEGSSKTFLPNFLGAKAERHNEPARGERVLKK